MDNNDNRAYSRLTAPEIEASLHADIDAALLEKYGPAPDAAIEKRVRDEWEALRRSGTILEAATLYEVTCWLRERNYAYWCRASTGSSFLFYLLGISLGNPLPPHTYCPKCHAVCWQKHVKDGFDLRLEYAMGVDAEGEPRHGFTRSRGFVCPEDGTELVCDGHDVPWQSLFGYDDHVPLYYIDIDETAFEPLTAFLEDHWLHRLKPEAELILPHPDCSLLKYSCIEFGCMLDHTELSSSFYEKEVTERDIPKVWVHWKEMIYYDPEEEGWFEFEELMREHYCPPEDRGSGNAPSGDDAQEELPLPEKRKPMFHRPRSFAETVYAYGLCHSSGLWDMHTGFLVFEMGYSLAQMIPFWEDIFAYLRAHGFSEHDAWYGMEYTHRRFFRYLHSDEFVEPLPTVTEEMESAPDVWILSQLYGWIYAWPKAQPVEHFLFKLRARDWDEAPEYAEDGEPLLS